MLPQLESPVTRQEKMATVWDEAEVGAWRGRGRGTGASGEVSLSGVGEVAGGSGLIRGRGRGRLERGQWS